MINITVAYERLFVNGWVYAGYI